MLSPERLVEAINDYQMHSNKGSSQLQELLQYGRTAGIICELVARQLRIDQLVPAHAERLLVTSGCQEAITLCLSALCLKPDDVLLLCNPTYTGAVGAAQACRIQTRVLDQGNLAEAIEKAAAKLVATGSRPRALYLVPDFDNPTGTVIEEEGRRKILDVCARHQIVILEDSAYSLFRFEGQQILPLAALDAIGCVIHLSTFSKTLCPGLRVGAAALPETLFGSKDAQQTLWRELVRRKSYITVNTSSVSQSIVGGLLLAQNNSLQSWITPAVAEYRKNRDVMLQSLDQAFGSLGDVGWNRPSGGFFLTLDLPFAFGAEAVIECATQNGVIVMPMAFFAFDASHDHRVRLAFSAVNSNQISSAIEALGNYVTERMAGRVMA